MPVYMFEAMDSQGNEIKDSIDALSHAEAISRIQGMGYFPIKVQEQHAHRRSRPKPLMANVLKYSRKANRRIKVRQLTEFTRQFSTLQDAGLPILQSLRLLEEQEVKGQALGETIKAVADRVENGATLSEAMAAYPRAFDRLYTSMIAAGETGGVLELILNRLADFKEKAQALKRKIVGAMIYPISVLLIAFAIVLGIMTWVVPKFRNIFNDFGTELPVITQTLMNISDWIAYQYGWAVLTGIPAGIVLLARLIRMSQKGRYILDAVDLKIPAVGALIRKTVIARSTRTLGTLIAAGVPILEALTITRETTGNELYRRAFDKAHQSIRKGEPLADPLRQSGLCSRIVVNMIHVGEQTGDLDKMLIKIADNYDDEVDTAVGALISLMEPVMVVFLGLVCGFIIIALFWPIIHIINFGITPP
ncbi:MAG: type II secretion system F family protein [Sedimentisphaerales bacterium]|nr:type II secretion system F family protein [Sedimentisphaerales bacterium]